MQVFTIIYLKQTVFLGYTGWSKCLCAPLDCFAIIRCTETFGSEWDTLYYYPCYDLYAGIYNYIPETNRVSRIYRVIKRLCAPLDCFAIIRCTETFGSEWDILYYYPCYHLHAGIYNYIPETNRVSRIYRVMKMSLCTFGLFCNHQVHRDFRKRVGHPVLLSLLPPSCRYLQLCTWNKPCF